MFLYLPNSSGPYNNVSPVYVTLGSKLVFREGRTKGQGIIKRIIYEDDPEAVELMNYKLHYSSP